jgi:dihydrofolate reductase
VITLVAARARNGAIGRAGAIPWEVPEDLALFQRETVGGAVIMGRATWDSLPPRARPLKGRLNLVVTSQPLEGEGAQTCASLAEALAAARAAGIPRIYGIGGARIYAALLPLADRVLLTEVGMDVPDADTFFPPFDGTGWRLMADWVLREAGPRCVVRDWGRRG